VQHGQAQCSDFQELASTFHCGGSAHHFNAIGGIHRLLLLAPVLLRRLPPAACGRAKLC